MNHYPRATTALLVVIVACGAYGLWMLQLISSRVSNINSDLSLAEIHSMMREVEVQTIETKWEDENCDEQVVKTSREEGESAKEFSDRHDEMVDLRMKKYPRKEN